MKEMKTVKAGMVLGWETRMFSTLSIANVIQSQAVVGQFIPRNIYVLEIRGAKFGP